MSTLFTGKNIKYLPDNNAVIWDNKTSQLFTSLNCFTAESKPVSLKYKGSGHFYCGLSSSDGRYVEKCRFLAKVKNEHGLIGFENRNGVVVITSDGRDRMQKNWTEIESKTEGHSIYLCISVKFGDVQISHKDGENENPFVSLTDKKRVKRMKLKSPELNCEVGCWTPLKPSTYSHLEISPVAGVNWWKVQMYLSNQEPSRQISLPSDKIEIPFNHNNPKGVITLSMSSNKCTYTYMRHKNSINMEQLHLSENVYLWLIVFRCQVKFTLNNQEETNGPYKMIELFLEETETANAPNKTCDSSVTYCHLPIQATDDNEHTTPKVLENENYEERQREADKEFKMLEDTLEKLKELFEINPDLCFCVRKKFHEQLENFTNMYDYDSKKLADLKNDSEQLFS